MHLRMNEAHKHEPEEPEQVHARAEVPVKFKASEKIGMICKLTGQTFPSSSKLDASYH